MCQRGEDGETHYAQGRRITISARLLNRLTSVCCYFVLHFDEARNLDEAGGYRTYTTSCSNFGEELSVNGIFREHDPIYLVCNSILSEPFREIHIKKLL
jgi:hypothetical protein